MQEVKASAEGVSDALKLHGSDSDGGLLYDKSPHCRQLSHKVIHELLRIFLQLV